MPDPVLYIVATPIGNLSDMVPRAVEVLQTASVIAAEDTRHSARLMSHFNIDTPLVSYHDHSDPHKLTMLLSHLQEGHNVALISDAGTPLISDPGYKLVRFVRESGYAVVPIPGSCAAIAALSAAGLPTDRFIFEGFLPSKAGLRAKRLNQLTEEERTLIFYESPRRILATVQAMVAAFGPDREAVIARELTKIYETILSGNLQHLDQTLQQGPQQCRGEFVVVLAGAEKPDSRVLDAESERVLNILVEKVSVKQAAELTAQITGVSKNVAYKAALEKK